MAGFKRIYAEDLAAALFDWEYDDLEDWKLYAALEEQGYDWDGTGWVPADAQENDHA